MTGARHVAIIMDGNGRWAKKRRLPRFFGHKQGVDALTEAGVRALEGLAPAAPATALPGAIDEIRTLVARLAPPEKAA